ncbi:MULTISPECIES: hypothetical protein [Acinetobacter]|uniref:hypothetical protein n=1 Tax=Acinetobacter TaxID=469 RepID=UPI0007EB95CD|nr:MULTISPECIES: hypothetical protein [Acinetobacter]EKT9248015.1 hypothetical protein [Acinetobacter baumannii]EKV8039610.1 hypothetical protein [Acinetobacter baumannii]MBE2308764.1 hypothetical protein [Acinetobacter baumannii]MBE2623490.1 hypothetical protein [Acinetobacter baumannii]MBE2653572.1 hypothetical protein [Acinetobacter baumannii]
MTTNTHELFKTIDHQHIGKDLKEVLIVECEDGRWFIENNWGDEDFEKFEGISNPHLSPYINPKFFTTENKVLEYAISIVCSVIPDFTYYCEE